MGQVIEYDPTTVPVEIANANTRLALSGQDEGSKSKGMGFFATAGETYMHETWVGQLAQHGIYRKDEDTLSYEIDQPLNVFKYFDDNKEKYAKLRPLLLDGVFDDVYSEQQFIDRAKRLTEEMNARERIANGNGVGALAGGILSIADISTFVPGIGVLKKANTAGRIGKVLTSRPVRGIGMGVYQSGVQEVGLHVFQELRTFEESALNTAIAGGFGGTLGTIGAAIHPGSPMHPKNPNFILAPENRLVMGVKAMGAKVSESPAFQPVLRNGQAAWDTVASAPMPSAMGGSVGAAAVKAVELAKAGGSEGLGVVRKGVQAVGKAGVWTLNNTIGKATPIGRGLQAASGKMRNLTAAMYDLGGVLTEGHKKGQYIESMEDMVNLRMNDFNTNVLIKFGEAYTGLQMALAKLAGKEISATGVYARDIQQNVKAFAKDVMAGPRNSGKPRDTDYKGRQGNLMKSEFEDLVSAVAHKWVPLEMRENLVQRFGDDGADLIFQTVERQVDTIRKFNKAREDKLVELGMMEDKDRLGEDYVSSQLWYTRGKKEIAKGFFLSKFAQEPSEEFLTSVALTKEQFDKLGKEEVVVQKTRRKSATEPEETYNETISVEEGLRMKNELLGEWVGELRDNQLAAIEQNLKEAEERFAAASKEAVLSARELRKTATDIKHATVDEAEAILKARQTERDLAATERDKAKLEVQKAKTDLQLAEAELKAREARKATIDTSKLEAKAGKAGAGDVKEAVALMNMTNKDPNATKADMGAAKDLVVEADLARADKLNSDVSEIRRRAEEENQTSPISNERIATLRERLNGLNKNLYKLEQRIKRLDTPLDILKAKVTDTKIARQHLEWIRKLRNGAANEAKREKGKAKTALKRAKKKYDKADNMTLADYVDNMVEAMSSRNANRPPLGMIDTSFMESSRLKMRSIKLTPEERARAVELGILRGDLIGTMVEAEADLAKHIAFREKFGGDGGTADEIVERIRREVEEEYDSLIAKANKEGKPRVAKRLQSEKISMIGDGEAEGDIVRGFKRQMGVLSLPENPEALLGYSVAKAREFNFVRYGGGFLISSLTDVSNVVLTTGFGTFTRANARALDKTVQGMANPEIRRMASAMELILHNSRSMKINSVDDMRNMSGIGMHGTMKHYTTSTVDRALGGLGQATSYLSGMMWWNTRLKMLSMVEMQHNFVGLAAKYDQLLSEASAGNKASELKVAQLASLGLGADQMRRVQKMLTKHTPGEYDGVYELNMVRWLKEGSEGQQAYQDVLRALENTANRAVMTPGKGDTPFLMSNQYMKAVLQFQTYGYTIMNRFMMPAFQRMASNGDMEAFMSLGLAYVMGSAVTSIKDIINDGKIKDRTLAQWGYDSLDRAGFTAYLSSYLSAGARLTGIMETSRYSKDRSLPALVGGPTGSLIQEGWDLAQAVGDRDGTRVLKIAQKLTPFQMHQKLIGIATGN